MSRFLLAWELGGNYGHVEKLAPLAGALKEDGHEVGLAVRDLAICASRLDPQVATLFQAPLDVSPGMRQPVSFADILADGGFGSPERLSGLIRGWHGLFDLYRPDAVIAEYAPLAIFAARLAGIPCLHMDTGFAIPPETSPYPCFRPWLKIKKEELQEKEARILSTVNQVRKNYGHAPMRHLFQAVRADLTLLTTVPELDHYPKRRQGRYIGPLMNLDARKILDWPVGQGRRIFTYLRPFPQLEPVLEGLEASGGQVIAVIPGIEPKLSAKYGSSLSIIDEPISLLHILPQADLVISHASHGLTSAALLAGVPTLAIPTQIEQLLLATAIERLGIGMTVTPQTIRTRFREILKRMLTEKEVASRADEVAAKYAQYDRQTTLNKLVKTIVRLPEIVKNRQLSEGKR